MRNIPATMATQHPDNAFAPYWDKGQDPFVGTHKEIKESVVCFRDLGVSEYMWDWEGKHADAAVIDKLFTQYYDYFAAHRLGHEKFLTFRLPNIWEEKGYSLLQAMTVILSSEDFARDLQFKDRPLFEVILPMTQKASQLMHLHTLFQNLADFKTREFNTAQAENTSYLEVIPLVESVESQQAVGKLLTEYVQLHQEHFGKPPAHIRPFFARSDPALSSGLLATVIANKLGLVQAYEFAQESGIPVFPISGVGSLPFRGGLAPDTVDDYLQEYPGIRTVSIQSSFRYDFPAARVKSAIAKLEVGLPKTAAPTMDKDRQSALAAIGQHSARLYQQTIQGIAPDLISVFAAVPKRRERRQHIGLLAYGRSMGEQQLPRAITFTAGFYSLGVPPEFIGFGRALKKLSSSELTLLREEYRCMDDDLRRAGRYLNTDNLAILAKRNSAWKQVQADIAAVEQILGITIGARSHIEKAHKNLTANVLLLKNNHGLPELIAETARLRRSLG